MELHIYCRIRQNPIDYVTNSPDLCEIKRHLICFQNCKFQNSRITSFTRHLKVTRYSHVLR